MIKHIIICDKCKKEITKGEEVFKLQAKCIDSGTGEDKGIIEQDEDRHYHKCCIKEIFVYANKTPKETEPAAVEPGTIEPISCEPETPEPKTSGKEETKAATVSEETGSKVKKSIDPKKEEPKKTLDIGKIMALRKAGWTYEQIADELGTSKARIASAIYKYRHKDEKK